MQSVDNVRHSFGGVAIVHGYAYQLAACCYQLFDLFNGGGDVGGRRVGHRLHDDRMTAANGDFTNPYGRRLATCFDSRAVWRAGGL